MTVDELNKYSDEEFKNIDRVIEELFNVYKPEQTTYSLAEQAAMATFIVNVYGGIENILKKMLIYDKLDIDDSPEWHEKLLQKSSEIGILPPELFQVLSRYLSFRNFFIYNYAFNIKWEDMKVLVDALKDLNNKFRAEIDEYLQVL